MIYLPEHQLKKDGTVYLAEVTVNKHTRLEFVKWGSFALSINKEAGWSFQNGLGLKYDKIQFISDVPELYKVLEDS